MTIRSVKSGVLNSLRGAVTSVATPTEPTINAVANSGETGAVVDVSLTFPNIGASATNYTVTSSPGGVTASGNSSPITVNGLTPNTSYTFTATGTGANGAGIASPASTSVTTPSAYILQETFTNSGTFTVPAGVSKVAVFATGGGNGGANGGPSIVGYFHLGAYYGAGSGGAGGRSSSVSSFTEFDVTPAATYSVTIGAGGNAGSTGGTTSFGSLVSISEVTVTGNAPSRTTVTPSGGGAGGPANAGYSGPNFSRGFVNNTALTNSQTLTGLGAVTYNQTNGGGGGGGGNNETVGNGQGGTSNIGGGSGGAGGQNSAGSAGTTGNLRGSGGGGGGGRGNYSAGGGAAGGAAGGAGQGGAVYVYAKY
jgi:hypothetical protein